jgi:LacI family transcriptional regulator
VLVTLKDVARRAGVSTATAGRVLGGYGYSSAESRRKVLRAARELGYRVDAVARSLATGRTNAIGLVVADIENPFFAEAARGVSDVAAEHGNTVILANTDEDVGKEETAITVLLEKRVDGLIVTPASSEHQENLAPLLTQGFAVVMLDRKVEGLAADSVLVQNIEGARQAVAYLINLGHKRIGAVCDSLQITTNIERIAGYRQAHAEAGLPLDESLIRVGGYTRQAALEETKALLALPCPPTALFAANNFMTIGALLAIRETGRSIPKDVALVGFDDMDWTTLCQPQLTTVAQPVYELGRVAAERLLARIKGDQSPPAEIRLPVELVVRESCGVMG